MLLAGDVGGTKTNLALYDMAASPRTPAVEASLPSAHYASLEDLVRDFLKQHAAPVERAAFGVAGPVVDGQATITNLPWKMDEAELARGLGIARVALLNDLEALATAVPALEPADLLTLSAGTPEPHGALAVIAPGTGLGEAFVTFDGDRYRTHGSEGGHADFAPANATQLDLLRTLQARFGHVSYERVCAGIGIPNLYGYLKDVGAAPEPAWLAERLASATDHTPVIVAAAMETMPPDPLCDATLTLFVSILGAEAGNLALKVLAVGGVYVGGGLPPRMLPHFQKPGFLDAFRNKGRFADLLARVPVHVILNSQAGLLGAALRGSEL